MTSVSVSPGGRREGARTGQPHVRELDWLLLVTISLCCLGLVMAVSVRGSQLGEGPLFVMQKQGFKLLAGLIAFLVAAMTPVRFLRHPHPPLALTLEHLRGRHV